MKRLFKRARRARLSTLKAELFALAVREANGNAELLNVAPSFFIALGGGSSSLRAFLATVFGGQSC
jgi:hypothetical protein